MPVFIVREAPRGLVPGRRIVRTRGDGSDLREAVSSAWRLARRRDSDVFVVAPPPERCRGLLVDGAALERDLWGTTTLHVESDEIEAPDESSISMGSACASASQPPELRRTEASGTSLDDELARMDEGFSGMLLRKIDELGMTDAECYHRANVDRRLFSKIRSNPGYRPSKRTAVAFAVALRLSPEETDELLRKAGFALSRSSTFDIICSHYIREGMCDVMDINQALYAYDQPLLGS